MGVTLERVQNKFACIIGELCSEPVILSQFAIWVDLRIAEYKAKGAISLECSGEDPDPGWLKGHNPSQPSVKMDLHVDATPVRHSRGMGDNSLNRQHSDTLSHSVHSNIDQSEEAAARLSPDIVVIKEEPVEAGDDVFPVSLHRHDSSTSNRNTPRKRTSAETIGQSDPGSSTSTSKIRRLSSSSSPALLVEPVNQSLMSIISEGALDEAADNSANFSLDYSGLDPNTEDNSSSVFQSQPVPSTSSAESGDQQDNNSTDQMIGDRLWAVEDSDYYDSWKHYNQGFRAEIMIPPSLDIGNIKARVLAVGEEKTSNTVRYIAIAVRGFERWLFMKCGRHLQIEELSTSELDQKLTEVYYELRKSDGTEPDVGYLTKFRSLIERFLRENNYPASIIKSIEFYRSQQAFNRRKQELQKPDKK